MNDVRLSEREQRVWRVLVGMQAAAVAAVLIAMVIVWVIAHTGAEFASR